MLTNDTNKQTTPTRISMQNSNDFRLYLQQEFLKRCEKNQRYNLSAFARFLDMDKSTLAKVLKGQRAVRKKAIQTMGLKLGLDPDQIARFSEASPRKNARNSQNKTDEAAVQYQQLTLDSFQIISDWYHYAILELMRLPHFNGDAKWIANKLGITATEAQIAIERLIRVEMLEITKTGTWVDLTGGYSTTLQNNFTAAAFKNMQRQLLEKALVALEEVPFEKRSQSSTTMAIDSKKIPQAKQIIAEFQRKMNQLLNAESLETLDDVYTLNVSLYPITQTQSKKSEGK